MAAPVRDRRRVFRAWPAFAVRSPPRLSVQHRGAMGSRLTPEAAGPRVCPPILLLCQDGGGHGQDGLGDADGDAFEDGSAMGFQAGACSGRSTRSISRPHVSSRQNWMPLSATTTGS